MTAVGPGTAVITVTVNGVSGGVYEIADAGQAIDGPAASTTPGTAGPTRSGP